VEFFCLRHIMKDCLRKKQSEAFKIPGSKKQDPKKSQI